MGSTGRARSHGWFFAALRVVVRCFERNSQKRLVMEAPARREGLAAVALLPLHGTNVTRRFVER